MTTKNSSSNSLATVTTPSGFSYMPQNSLSQKEARKTGAELGRQELAITAIREKTMLANEGVGVVNEHAMAVMTVTANHIQSISQQASGGVREVVNAFAYQQCESLADALHGITVLANHGFAREVARPVYQPAEEPKHWWQK
ncbi:MAG: hypothetical protein BGO39_15675 [Chloroflexi bacterium 54-19]|nr:MAG: hypothetical protein BGO39_15675 [Chloroflexi bacterium 54-19]